MVSYAIRRVTQTVFTLLGLSIVVFAVLRLSGDPARFLLSPDARPEDLDAFREILGLNAPIYEQYVNFLAHALRGDFGISYRYHVPALELVLERLPASLLLTTTAMAIAVIVGGILGIVAATRKGSWLDAAIGVFVLVGQSAPLFWVGLVLIIVFSVQFRLLPTSGYGTLQQLVLPAVTLALYSTASITLMTRASLLNVLDQDYIRTGRAKGLGEGQVIRVHALKNAAIPVVTLVALHFSILLGSAAIIETIFAWPGIGLLAVQAVFQHDFPLVQASVFVAAVVFVLASTVLDLLYPVLDPRIRLGSR